MNYLPSTTLLSLILGPDSPFVDDPSKGNLRVSEHWILTNVFVTQSDILTFISSIPVFTRTSAYNETLSYRYTVLINKFFVYPAASANYLVP